MDGSAELVRGVSVEAQPQTFNLLHALYRFRFRAALVFIACLLAGLVLIMVQKPVYESRAILLVKFGRDQVYTPEVGANPTAIVPVTADQDEAVSTQVQLFSSRDLIVKTIEQLGVFRLYPELAPQQAPTVQSGLTMFEERLRTLYDQVVPSTVSWFHSGSVMDRAVKQFQASLSISRTRASTLVQIAFRHHDPAMARTVLEILLTGQRRLATNVNDVSNVGFYETVTKEAEDRLSDAQKRLSDFRAKYGALAFQGELTTLLEQRDAMTLGLQQAHTELAAAEGRAAGLDSELKAMPQQIRAYTETATGSHFAGVVRDARNPTLIELENDIQGNNATRAALNGRIHELQRQVAAMDNQLLHADEIDATRTRLESEVTARQLNFHNLAVRREEARALANLAERQIDNVSLVQTPNLSAPDAPVRPAPLLYMAIAGMVGIAGAATLASVSSLFGRRASRSRRVMAARDNHGADPTNVSRPLVAHTKQGVTRA